MFEIILFYISNLALNGDAWILLKIGTYFPTQKFRNIFPKTSSVLISPTISPR